MKKLLLVIIAFVVCQVQLSAQRIDSVFASTTFPLPLSTQVVVPTATGLWLFQSNYLIETDFGLQKKQEYNFDNLLSIKNYSVNKAQSLALLGQSKENEPTLILTDLKSKRKDIYQKTLVKGKYYDIALLNNNQIISLAEIADTLQFQKFNNKGEVIWNLPFQAPKNIQDAKLLTTPNKGFVCTIAGQVWAFDEAGRQIWLLDSGKEATAWMKMVNLKNGNLLLLGTGSSVSFDAKDFDARVMEVDAKTGKQLWVKSFGEPSHTEVALDVVEQTNGNLWILMQENTQAAIIEINKKQDAKRVGVLPKPFVKDNTQFVYSQLLMSNETYSVVGLNQGNDPKMGVSYAFMQTWETKTKPKPSNIKKGNLYGVSIGVEQPNLKYTSNDAQQLAKVFMNLQGIGFDTVRFDVKTKLEQTTTTKIASSIERMTYEWKSQADDWVIVFISGLAKTQNGESRILGSDYDEAAPRSTSFSLKTILNDLNQMSGNKLVLLDAEIKTDKLDEKQYPNIHFLVASQDKQKVYENADWQHGAFTKALLEAIDGKADTNNDGKLYLSELYAYLSEQVPILVREKQNTTQQPTWLLRGKDVVLVEK